uniref:RanBD1 domain-containing protein n=1 Tax=Zooxanthella nutricula TaxID=1333877 RepID=A0A7S2VND2_9DINO
MDSPLASSKDLPDEPFDTPAEKVQATHLAQLRAVVDRMTLTCSGFKRHDTRTLELSEGRVRIFSPGSSSSVKSCIDVGRDVHECSLHRGWGCGPKILLLSLSRPPPARRALLRGRAQEQKLYFFEFASEDVAADFHREIRALRPAGDSREPL